MVFNSLHFVAFFLVVYALYRALPHRAQNWLLLGASYYFYASWDWRYLGLLVGSTVVDFFVGQYLGADRLSRAGGAPRSSRAWCSTSACSGSSSTSISSPSGLQSLFAALGWRLDPITVNVILPIGISFYTFMTISYVIDVYRREIPPAPNFVDFALFVAYFPHLVAGPILRASLLLPQIARPRTITAGQISEGLWLIALGRVPEDVRRRQSGAAGRHRVRAVGGARPASTC